MMESSQQATKVLVVDDSAVNRRAICDVFREAEEFELVGTAEDGEIALRKVFELKPDLITLDLQMPKMDGFTFLRLLMAQCPTPVIVISSQSERQVVFQALEIGALDFAAKPVGGVVAHRQHFAPLLLSKARLVRSLHRRVQRPTRLDHRVLPAKEAPKAIPPVGQRAQYAVVIGASTGGPQALQLLLQQLKSTANVAILIAQHMPERFTKAFAERLDRLSHWQVVEASSSMQVYGGCCYIAPGNQHFVLTRLQGQLQCQILPVHSSDHYSPSVDKLFASVAEHFQKHTLGIVLTGMGADGREGVRAVHQAGGTVWSESKESALIYGMPSEAFGTGCVHQELALPQLIRQLEDKLLYLGQSRSQVKAKTHVEVNKTVT